MATLTDPEAEQSTNVDAGIDQAEAFANDPANATNHVDALRDKTAGSNPGVQSDNNRLRQVAGAIKGFSGRNKKQLMAGGGAVGIIALIIGGLIGLATQELEAMMKNIEKKEMAKVEHTLKQRATKAVTTVIFDKLAAKTAASESPILATLYNNLPITKIQDSLSKRGYTLAGGEDGQLHLKLPGEDTPRSFASSDEFAKFLSANGGADASNIIATVTEDSSKYLEVWQRHFFRQLLQNEFDVKNWKAYDNKEGADASKEIADGAEHAATDGLQERLPSDVGCILDGNNCPPNEDSRKLPDGHEPGVKIPQPPNQSPGECASGESADACQSRTNSLDSQAGDPNAASQVESQTAQAAGEGSELFDKELFKEIAGKVSGPTAILSTAASLDNGLYNDSFGKLIRERREVQYVGVFAHLETELSQIHEGKSVSGDEFNATMKLLQGTAKTPGIEGSAAFSDIFLNKQGVGKKIDPSKLIGGGKANTADSISSSYKTYIGNVIHGPLQVYKNSIGKALSWVGDILGKVLNTIPGVSNLSDFISKYMGKLINYALGTVVTGAETGADLMNATTVGADVSANAFARDTLGAPALTGAQATLVNQQIALANTIEANNHSLAYRLFSPSYAGSMTNYIAIVAPHSYGQAAAQTGDYIGSLLISPFRTLANILPINLIFGPTFAATDVNGVDENGVQQYGYTDAQLNQPLNLPKADLHGPPGSDGKLTGPDGKIDQWDCYPAGDDGTSAADTNPTIPNLCLADTATILSMSSVYTTADDGGLGGSSKATASGGALTNGNEQLLAQQILANSKITFDYGPNGSVAAPFHDLASGQLARAADGLPSTDVNVAILNAILLIAQTHSVNVSSLTTGHSAGDVHSIGRAVDINYLDGIHLTGRDAGSVTIINILAPVLPSGSRFGQDGCGATPPLPPGITSIDDVCGTHLHIDLGRIQ